jgi:magnesium transporter
MTNELTLCQGFIDAHRDDAARAIERLPEMEAAALLAALPAPTAARALDAMMPPLGADCLARLDTPSAAAIVAGLRPGRAAVLLRHVDDSTRGAILEQMPQDEARALRAALRYAAGTAGAVMDSRILAARESQTAGDVLGALRRSSRLAHDAVFVVDDEHRLVGVVGLRALLTARPGEALAAMVDRSVGRVSASAARAAIINHPGWTRFHILPVVDDQSVLLGAIPHETVRALLIEDALGGPTRVDATTTMVALGELYWLGLSGVLDGVASAVRSAAARTPEVTHGTR